ncbi:MAG: quinone-dependent dihydroorotate dehydrogenase [Bdellovibrionales bacterium]|nr:quinone-dependent dihydroorotate dehydrogenase [Bdellovibrionales bacterium]
MVTQFLPPGLSHQMADFLLSLYSRVAGSTPPPEWRSFHWNDLYFPNPLAPAGGMDKSAKHIKAWWALGAGFIEIGTITPQAQKKNPGTTLKKDGKTQAIWNHLGFPGEGVEVVQKRLKKWQHFRLTPIFANIGKNRETKNEEAGKDYLRCISTLYPYVDGFVINVSSPNTRDLRELSRPQKLKSLLQPIQKKLSAFKKRKPFFIKWSPDMDENEFLRSLDVTLEYGVEGHIICNTSIYRDPGSLFPHYGGVSGAPLAKISKERLSLTQKHLGTDRKSQLIISVGGVLKPEDVMERLALGANLVQAYSALVFNGPFFFKKVHSFKTD